MFPAEGSRPHRMIKSVIVLLCMYVHVCKWEQITVHCMYVFMCTLTRGICIYVCSICMWAYEHLHVCGSFSQVITHMCSNNCCSVLSTSLQEVSLQLETKWKMTPAYAVPLQSIVCLLVPFNASLELNGTEVWKMSTSKGVQASTNPQIMTGRQSWT